MAVVEGGILPPGMGLCTRKVGTNYVYTLEGKESLASANWLTVPGASWPLKTNHWTLAWTNAQPPFYRVKAEALGQ